MRLSGSLTRLRLIVAMPLRERRGQGSVSALWFTIGFALFWPMLLLAGGAWIPGMLTAGGVLLAVVALALTLGWWAAFIIGVVQQASMPIARLVPGHARQLARAVWTMAIVLSVLFGVAIGLWVHWFVVPAIIVFVLLALVAALCDGQWLRIAVAVGLLVVTLPKPALWVSHLFMATTPTARADGVMALAGSLFIAAAMLASAAPLVPPRRIVRDPSEAPGHRRPASVPDTTPLVAPVSSPPGEAVQAPAMAVAPASATAATGLFAQAWWRTGHLPPGRVDPVARALSVLPLDTDWRFVLYRGGRTWLIVLAILALAAFTSLASHADEVFVLACIMNVVGLAGHVAAAWAALEAARDEQRLLVLMPGWQPGPAVARTLAWRLSASYLARLALAIAGLATLAAIRARAGGEPQWWTSAGALAAIAAACLPLVGQAWQDWSRAVPPTKAFGATAALTLWLVTIGAWRAGWVSLPVLVAFEAGATALYCAVRWARMAGEPAPFPVGRLA